MPSKNWTKATIGLFSAIILGTSLITGESIDEGGLKWISAASSAVIIMLLLFDKWAWRWTIICKISERLGHPVIYGTWKGNVEFDKDADNNPGNINCYISIYQTFSTLEIRGYFNTSSSYSITATIDHPRTTQSRLVYAYRGEAPHGKRETNRPSDGTAILDIIGTPVENISGSYFTDRGGTGRIVLNQHTSKLSGSYSQAEKRKFKKLS
jgi:hypothetical protein